MDQTTLKRYAVLLRVETVESHLVEVFAGGPEEARALAASLESLEEVDSASIMQGQDQDYPVLIPIRVMEMVEFDEAGDGRYDVPSYLISLTDGEG